MLSSQMLWPRLCSNSVAFIVSLRCGCRQMLRVIPQADHRLRWTVFIRQRAQAGRAQQKIPGGLWLETKPPGGQDPEEVGAGEQQHRDFHGPDAADDAVCPSADLRKRFSARESVPEWLPAGTLRSNVG